MYTQNDAKDCTSESKKPTEMDENTSYLDMSMRNTDGYALTKSPRSSTTNDYVDIMGKSSKECNDDDNIYDNYIVERTTTTPSVVTSTTKEPKPKCPFIGLPAAHLTMLHSPKVGWLTMHLRRKKFIRPFYVHFKRKYYTGLVPKHMENGHCEWWLLMYAGGTSDLKPTVTLLLNQFEACSDQLRVSSCDKKQQNEPKRNPCKFELNEKQEKKDAKSYCFVAESPEHCDHWYNLMKQLSLGLPHVESSFTSIAQIRKLPMPPFNSKLSNIGRLCEDIDTVDTNGPFGASTSSSLATDICNHSEGVYEEPEEYYKNVPTPKTKGPALPAKKGSQCTTPKICVVSSIYDTPTKSSRVSDNPRNYDLVSVSKANETNSFSDTNRSRFNEMDDEIRNKLVRQSDDSVGQRASDEEIVKNSSTECTSNKYQLNTMRKWLFSNHLATNFKRKSSGNSKEPTTQSQTNQRKKAAVVVSCGDAQKRAFSVQPKGNKVHMIINQLEANGQLTLLSGGSSTAKCGTLMSA